ncbi:hypothetical protein DV738_g3682, partial [Chaetothyriales sp. CBS 135597]
MISSLLLILAIFGSAIIIPTIAAGTPPPPPPPDSLQFGPSIEVAAQRGPAIFNSVHDSLRKWGSIVHPNGMSMFLATVPQGVLLHHGNYRNATPATLDWLADEKHGWLHTYRAARPLHFLYLDGLSGNKGHDGVTDTQEFLLRQPKAAVPSQSRALLEEDRPPGPPGEYELVLDVCNLLVGWGLDGMIRTEWAGFEIVKCEFPNGLEQVQRRLDYLLQVFIDHADAEDVRDSEAIKRCTHFYLRSIRIQTEADQLIYSAFEAVNNKICTTLFHARQLLLSVAPATPATPATAGSNEGHTLLRIHDSIQSLIRYLSWSAFKSDE